MQPRGCNSLDAEPREYISVDAALVDKPEWMQQSSKDQDSSRINQDRGRPKGSLRISKILIKSSLCLQFSVSCFYLSFFGFYNL